MSHEIGDELTHVDHAAVPPPPPPPPPEKRLGRMMSLAMVVGTIVGSGIYLLPAQVAPFGINLVAAFVLTGLGTFLLALSMARLAGALPGGPFSHVAAAFGDRTAFVALWSSMISQVMGVAATAIAVGGALGVAIPALRSPWSVTIIGVATIAILALVQSRGARSAGRVQVTAALIKLVPLLVVVILALLLLASGGTPQPLAPVPLGLAGTLAAAALMLFAFTGFEAGTISANVTDRSQELVPSATIRGTAFVALLYLFATVAVLWLLPSAVAASSPTPIADAIAPSLGASAQTLVALVGAISALGTCNALLLLSVEILRALANAGDLPQSLAVTDANGVARRGLWLSALLAAIMVLGSVSENFLATFNFVALVSAVGALVLYLACAAAAWRLKVTGAVIAVPAILYSLAMFYGSGMEAVAWGIVLALAGLPLRWLSRRTIREAAPAASPRG
ncbi:amino acid permease [Sphingomonas swuensis]|uniref:Arginine/agmatine antiporter n=1 Tax=Sphingomonas swuensis TaxID=977800 RepID=A0ABP7SY87_9SPHN